IPEPSCIVAISHPTNAPLMTRAESPMACVREGVFGSTSQTYSPTAATARTIPQMPPRTSNTAATGVKVRSPETKPRPRASKTAATPIVLQVWGRRIDNHSRTSGSHSSLGPSRSSFRRTHVPCALLPSFVAQPFLERPEMDFGIAQAEPLNVRLETGVIEP